MVNLLVVSNHDGGTIPAGVDVPFGAVDVTSVLLFRAENEGNPTALNAAVTFDAAEALFRWNIDYNFDIWVYVLTEEHVATLTNGISAASVADFDTPWDLSASSSGSGAIHAILVKTPLQSLR